MRMTSKMLRCNAVRAAALMVVATVGLTGCDLVDVTNPTRLEDHDVANATGADLMRRNALREFYDNAARHAGLAGVFTDEFYLIGIMPQLTDQQASHDLRLEEYQERGLYIAWHEVRHAATLARAQLEAYAPEVSRDAHIAQMLAVRGYAILRLGEDFCPGFPLHELDGYTPVYGRPLTATAEVLERALTDLDPAVALASDSARILHFASVARGRTLLGLGRFAEAAAAVAAVPTDYVFHAEYGATGTLVNPLTQLGLPGFSLGTTVADREGGNGLDFVSAADARVQTSLVENAPDGTPRWRVDKYVELNDPMVVASGIEARLIEAEAALATGGPWLGLLNELRATQSEPSLEPLADPGDAEARLDMLFRERAFWLFGTGHRLSDLRRLMRLYSRSSETLFPTGLHPSGAVYGTATAIRFPADLEAGFDPAVTGCTGE